MTAPRPAPSASERVPASAAGGGRGRRALRLQPSAPAPPAISGELARLRAGRSRGRQHPRPAPRAPRPSPAQRPSPPRSPATGDGLRSTSHLVFHCGDRGGVSVLPRPAPAPRPPRAPTFLPSRSLTWPSTSAASVIFCHGSRAPAAPLPAALWPPQPRVTFKIASGGPWAGPARAGRGQAGGRGVPPRCALSPPARGPSAPAAAAMGTAGRLRPWRLRSGTRRSLGLRHRSPRCHCQGLLLFQRQTTQQKGDTRVSRFPNF